MNYINVRSSQIKFIGYDKENSKLGIIFTGGAEYHYTAVPVAIAGELVFSSSIGSSFDRLIKKGGYEFKKIERNEQVTL